MAQDMMDAEIGEEGAGEEGEEGEEGAGVRHARLRLFCVMTTTASTVGCPLQAMR